MSNNDKKVPQRSIVIPTKKPTVRKDSVLGIVQKLESEPDLTVHVRNSAPAPKRDRGEGSE